MISPLVAIDPTSEKADSFEGFCSILRLFQQKGILSKASIASVIHPSLYAIPLQSYRKMKGMLAKEALKDVTQACQGRFDFESIKILHCDSHLNETLAARLSKYGQTKRFGVLVVSSSERTGIPHWLLGSFFETAALIAKIPVLVIKPHLRLEAFSPEVRFVLAVDTALPMTKVHLRWLIKISKSANAHVDLVYVMPRSTPLIDSLRGRQSKNNVEKVLDDLRRQFLAGGVSCKAEILEEAKTVAQTLADYAEKQKAWLTITVNAERSVARKILLGSTARRLLALTERPFLKV